MRPAALPALLLALCAPTPAAAEDTDGLYLLASESAQSAPGALAVQTSRGTSYVVPGARLHPTEVTVAASDNANTTYSVSFRYPHPGGSGGSRDCQRGVVRLGATTLLPNGWGGDATQCSVDLQVDPPTALQIAAFFGTTRQDRHPIGMHVTGAFRTARRRFHVGQPIEIVLTMTSPAGSPDVAWQHGGENRGPRDDQFDFTITRDGRPVARIEAFNFGGLSFMDGLRAGEHDEVRTPLAPWGDLTQPGHYEVDCSFHATFAPADVDPHTPTTRGQVWDRTFTGRVTFDVVR